MRTLLAPTRMIPAGVLIASTAAAAILLVHNARAVAELKRHVQEENNLGLRSTLEHVQDYFDSVYSTLLFISLDKNVQSMRMDSSAFIQRLYDHQWEHHRLSELYVIEREFSGRQKPFQAFERASEPDSVEELHSLFREREEYETHVSQIRQFVADTNLSALISSEINLCVNDPGGERARGVVYSVPIRSSEGLVAIAAGMIPTHILTDVLQRGQLQQVALLVNSRGEVYGGQPADEPLRAWLRDGFAQGGPAAFFARQPQSFSISNYSALWSPVEIVSAESWWLVYLYDRKTEFKRSVLSGTLNHVALSGALVLAGIALAFLARATARRLEDQVARLRERQQLERQVQEASEREQRRIGNDLHEDLCQRLAGIEAASTALRKRLATKSNPESDLAGTIADELHESLGFAQGLANQLQPVSLLEKGFLAAIQELAFTTQKRSGVPCHLVGDDFPHIPDPGVATHLYRIAQEALANAVQHARAKHIEIKLTANPTELGLEISDDGVGLPPEAPQTAGMGLRIIRYRSDLIGGCLEIAAKAGQGTVVKCRCPMPREAESVLQETTVS